MGRRRGKLGESKGEKGDQERRGEEKNERGAGESGARSQWN